MSDLKQQVLELTFAEVGIRLTGPSFRRAVFSDHIETYFDGGVRGGKTTAGDAKLKGIADWRAFEGSTESLLFWVVGRTYELCHQEMEYLYKWAMKATTYRVTQWNHPQEGQWTLGWEQMTMTGQLMRVVVETKSAEKDEGLASVAPDAILVAEAGQCSPVIRDRVLERASEKGAPIIYSGTLENDEQTEQYAWFIENSSAALDEPSASVGAYSLPSWENEELYGSCLPQIGANPLYAEWCPEGEHGEAHSMLDHPVMRRLQVELASEEFDRRYGGKPVGLQFKVYPTVGEHLMQDVPDNTTWIGRVGGLDYGTVHPTVLVACTIAYDEQDSLLGKDAPQGVLWVREVWFNGGNDPGDTYQLESNKKRLSLKWGIREWGADPNEKFAAKNDPLVESVSGTDGSRNYRINLLKTRINLNKLRFDQRGEGCREAMEEMTHIHRYKTRAGKLELRRSKDDRTAGIENCCEVKDGIRRAPMPKPYTIKHSHTRRPREVARWL